MPDDDHDFEDELDLPGDFEDQLYQECKDDELLDELRKNPIPSVPLGELFVTSENLPHWGRPKEDHDERDRKWLEQFLEYTAKGMSQRKAAKEIAKGQAARDSNVSADYIRNVVLKLRKSQRAVEMREHRDGA